MFFFVQMEINNKRTDIYPRKDATLPIGVLESSLTGQQDVKDDHLCIQAPKDIKVNILSLFTYLNAISSAKPNGSVVDGLKGTCSCEAIFLQCILIFF